jgi:hypothetical protein
MSRNTGIMAEMDYRYFVLYTVLWVGIKRPMGVPITGSDQSEGSRR